MPLETLPADPGAMEVAAVAKALQVDTELGLSSEEVRERLATFGANELPAEPPTPFWKLVLAQFEDTLVRILLLAALTSFVMALLEQDVAGFVEPFIILLILVLNATVGVWQENRAESAIEALKSLVPKTAVALRNGRTVNLQAEELVPGDVVEVAVGNRVPADMRVIELHSTTLRADQAILNGESIETMKQSEPVKGKHERYPASMVYSGTAIVYGKALCIVVRTGSSTEVGAIERDVREQEEVKTPLQVKLDEFGVLLSKVIGYICLAVFAINMVRWYATHKPKPHEPWYERYIQPTVHCLKVAVALAVAAIPEGLPAVVTTCLALGTRRMARHDALVRDLPSVETLGRCTVICSDKTGTLTTNMMSVLRVFTLNKTGSPVAYELKDSQFNIVPGAVTCNGQASSTALLTDGALNMLSNIAVLCNDASLHYNATAGQVEKIGEATEAALLVMAEKLANPSSDLSRVTDFRVQATQKWRKNSTLEFTRQRKSMSVHCSSTSESNLHSLFVKGAPEEVLRRSTHVMQEDGIVSPLTAKTRSHIMSEIDKMSGSDQALRCIGFAFKSTRPEKELKLGEPEKFESIESDLTFVGTCGMLDPPRKEVREAIADCHSAGIRVVVITGDRKETAEAVCRQLGLLSADATGLSFTGHEFDAMSVEKKRQAAMSAVLFSRTEPSHKMQLVKILQEERLICAMTGDGVNDAPALKKADIGIAMGSGTEVAKGASKMVLADDNFATVVKAVREGRSIFNNTKQFIRYLISSNIGEVACILVTGLFGLPEALSPVQLLWVNLVTDGLPATALGFNAADPDIMDHPPRRVDEPIVNGWLFLRYMVVGTYVGLATVGGFLWWFLSHGFTWNELTTYATCTDMQNVKCAIIADPETARAIALSILVVVEMVNALNALSENQSIVVTRPTSNIWLLLAIFSSLFLHVMIMYIPFLAKMFNIAPLGVDPQVVKNADPWSFLIPTDFEDWKVVLVFSIPVLFIDEFLKFFTRHAITRRKTEKKKSV